MIILTGHEGFIGKKFLEKLSGKNVFKVEKSNSWHLDKVLINGKTLS